MQPKLGQKWMSWVLVAAGIYNILWGAVAVVAPALMFDWLGATRPNYPELWQCIGMIVGVYGIGYAIASTDPLRHWPVVLVGFLGKVLGPFGMARAIADGRFPIGFAWISLANDLIWWIPFALILREALLGQAGKQRAFSPDIQNWAMRARSQFGISIHEHSKLRPALLVFLRHVGCPFCREALADLKSHRTEIEATGTQILLVHMGHEETAEAILARYALDDVPRVADPNLALYRAFGLEKGEIIRTIGPGVWWPGIKAAFGKRHGFGIPDGDITQMPGVFLVFHGEILKSYRHQSAADRPDYVVLVSELSDPQMQY